MGQLDVHRAVGRCQGRLFPSFSVSFRVEQSGAELRYAEEIARKHQMESVMHFYWGTGPWRMYTLKVHEPEAEEAVADLTARFR
jgi:hypothetical protein